MKLLACLNCNDIVVLAHVVRACYCGQSFGSYEADGCNAWYVGATAVPLGFANGSFAGALRDRPDDGLGSRFEAFVIPRHAPTFRQQGENERDRHGNFGAFVRLTIALNRELRGHLSTMDSASSALLAVRLAKIALGATGR